MVSHLARIAPPRKRPKPSRNLLGLATASALGALSRALPTSGAKITAPSQETISEIATTAKIEKVYSPAELRAKPIGTKPEIDDQRADQHRRASVR